MASPLFNSGSGITRKLLAKTTERAFNLNDIIQACEKEFSVSRLTCVFPRATFSNKVNEHVRILIPKGRAVDLSDNAKKLLQYFQHRNLREMEYEWPLAMEELFGGDLEACEMAQEELARAGLLALGSPRLSYEISGVRSAALTRDGTRHMQKNS